MRASVLKLLILLVVTASPSVEASVDPTLDTDTESSEGVVRLVLDESVSP